ncbi:RNase H domain-containing protein [Trichonephila clavipes]|nr:RNase H domain-containing protein [Trichonephila clavipes]
MIAFNKARSRARKIHRQRKREWWIKYVTSHVQPQVKRFGTKSLRQLYPCISSAKASRGEGVKLNFSSSNEEGYNSPLTLRELRAALHRSGNTAAGPDGLHYIMLRHLSESSIFSLLSLFNRIWETQVFPTQWCHAHVLPFPKPGKDPTSANNYHPIALTSCLSKLMERIVSARLMFHLESHNLFSPLQSGFRKSRSTTDNLLRLETSIREAFVKKQALIRSKLDYGSLVYSSACKSLLKIFDPVHHQALRLCLRAFRTSPVESLYAEAYEPPLDLRRKYTAGQLLRTDHKLLCSITLSET